MRRLAVLLATGFGVGRLPIAPASWASLLVALFLLYSARLEFWVFGAVILGIFVVGVWAAGEAERSLGHDASPIVIDEVAGMLLAVWGISWSSSPFVILGIAFLLFRLVDIWKPFPIRQSQRLPGGWGVMVDDVLAGLLTNLLTRVAIRVFAL